MHDCVAWPALAALATLAPAPPAIERVERMPDIPSPFAMRDWSAVARAFDRLAFDFDAKGEHLPLIWWDGGPTGIDGPGFGLPSYVGGFRGGSNHESVTCLGALLGATVAGIDKRAGPHDWVKMAGAYFSRANGEDLVLNRVNGRTGGSYWYEIFPSIVFAALADRYPGAGLEPAVRTIADRWREAVARLCGPDGVPSFEHTAFRFETMEPVDNGRWREPDAAAGIAWLSYAAWTRWKDPSHLETADRCMRFLDRRDANPAYEILMPFGAIAAARMNAELGRTYNLHKFINWCFEPSSVRPGWGIIAERWGDYDCHGLAGSVSDGGGYAFAMNTFVTAGALVPIARYETRYARAIGKWILNLANAARLFYADVLPADHQSCPAWTGDPAHAIAYEGLRRLAVVMRTPVAERSIRGRIAEGDRSCVAEGNRNDGKMEVLAEVDGRLVHEWAFEVPANAEYGTLTVFSRRAGDETYRVAFGSAPGETTGTVCEIRAQGSAWDWGDIRWDAAARPSKLYVRIEDAGGGAIGGGTLSIDDLEVRFWLPVTPYASGDPVVYRWGPKTEFGLYGSGYAGILAGLIHRTEDEKILAIDCLATDFFRGPAYPTYLVFNPYREEREVRLDVGGGPNDLYDAISDRFLARGVEAKASFRLAGGSAAVIVVAPAGKPLVREGRIARIGGVIVDYVSQE